MSIYIYGPPKAYVFNWFCGICTLPTQVWTCLSEVWTCLSEVWQVHLSGSKIQNPRFPGGLGPGILDLWVQDFSRRVSGHLGSWIWIQESVLEILDLGSKHYRPEVFKPERFSDLRFSSRVLVSLVLAYLEFYVELTWRSWHSDPVCCSGTVFVVASFVARSCFPCKWSACLLRTFLK